MLARDIIWLSHTDLAGLGPNKLISLCQALIHQALSVGGSIMQNFNSQSLSCLVVLPFPHRFRVPVKLVPTVQLLVLSLEQAVDQHAKMEILHRAQMRQDVYIRNTYIPNIYTYIHIYINIFVSPCVGGSKKPHAL